MGVMSCSRKDCENIMCDTYINGIGYVCNDCQSEFKEYLQNEGKTDLAEGEIKRELDGFMNTAKDDYVQGDKINVDDFFAQYSR